MIQKGKNSWTQIQKGDDYQGMKKTTNHTMKLNLSAITQTENQKILN